MLPATILANITIILSVVIISLINSHPHNTKWLPRLRDTKIKQTISQCIPFNICLKQPELSIPVLMLLQGMGML